jgi:hypothetical protein
LVSLILWIVCLVLISLILALIFIISLYLLIMGLVCSCFPRSLRCIIRLLSCELFFPLFLWLVASLIADSERALRLTGNWIHWVPFGFLWSPSFRIVSHHWAIGMSIISHLALPLYFSF